MVVSTVMYTTTSRGSQIDCGKRRTVKHGMVDTCNFLTWQATPVGETCREGRLVNHLINGYIDLT